VKKLLLIALAVTCLLSGCGVHVEPGETETPSTEKNGPSREELLRIMALSVSDGGLPTDRDAVFSRFADLASAGITAVRVDTSWNTSEKGRWEMTETTKNYLDAAKESGLMLKLILPTVMAPPEWLSADENTRLKDQNGRLSVNTVSYWYEDITAYSRMALESQLSAIVDGGWAEVICGIVVDMGPAGEPLYPPAWTQVASGLDLGGGEEVMWCYGENAVADFRAEMQKLYGDIASANAAWGTEYASFGGVEVPKPGECSGALWEDTLKWYYLTKREFMENQTEVFSTVTESFGLGEIPLILYLPGADVTLRQWEGAVQGGNAVPGIKMACDNRFTAELAAKKGCVLQYTGINGVYSLGLLRTYMYSNGLESVPVFGENAGDAVSASDIIGLGDTVVNMGLWGIDYTHTRWLYEPDGVTRRPEFEDFEKTVLKIKEYVSSGGPESPPEMLSALFGNAEPRGNVIRMDIAFRKPESQPLAYVFLGTDIDPVVIMEGDTLEYDVMLSAPMQGLGAVDGIFSGGETIRDSSGITDSLGIRAHPNADLSSLAHPGWYHRVLKIGTAETAGKELVKVMFAAHPESSDGPFGKEQVAVFYDNVVIRRGGQVIAVVFEEDPDFTVSVVAAQYARAGIAVADLGSAAENK